MFPLLRVRTRPISQRGAALANARIKGKLYMRESVGPDHDLSALGNATDPLIGHHHVSPGRGVNEKAAGTVTRKARHHPAVLAEREPGLERRIARFTLATHRPNRASADNPFQAG